MSDSIRHYTSSHSASQSKKCPKKAWMGERVNKFPWGFSLTLDILAVWDAEGESVDKTAAEKKDETHSRDEAPRDEQLCCRFLSLPPAVHLSLSQYLRQAFVFQPSFGSSAVLPWNVISPIHNPVKFTWTWCRYPHSQFKRKKLHLQTSAAWDNLRNKCALGF